MISQDSSTQCIQLTDAQSIVLNPFDKIVSRCDQDVLDLDDQKKMEFLCPKAETNEMDVFMLVVLIVLAFGALCCCTPFCLFCKYRAKTANSIEDADTIENRVHDPVAAQRMLEQHKKQRLTLISKQLKKLKHSNVKEH